MKVNEFFEEAFYINLDRRTDRKEGFEAQMKSVGLEGWVQRMPALPYTKGLHLKPDCDQCDKHAACGLGHQAIIKYAKEKGLKNVLILEDDVSFYNGGIRPGIDIIEDSLDQLSKVDEWDVIHLSAFMMEESLRLVSPNLVKCSTCLTGHAYGVNHTGYDKLLAYNPTTDCAHDGWMGQRHHIIKYVTYPLSIYQADMVSDLDAFGNGTGIGPYFEHYNKPVIQLYG